MSVLRNILKWTGIAVAALLLLLILAGLINKAVSPIQQPPGQLIDIDGHDLHINSSGPHNDKPTLVIVAGAGAPGEQYHWLNEGLKDSIRVVRYDRAGIGHSQLANSPRDPETEARELHKLLQSSGEAPPYLMAGHSYGGHYIRIFADLYPEDVAGLIFLDSSHPEMNERINFPDEPWFMDLMYRAGIVLADLGVLSLAERFTRPLLWAPGLPDDVIESMRGYSLNGDYLRGFLRGDDRWGAELSNMAAAVDNLGDLPIQVFSGTNQRDEALRRIGIDPEHFRSQRCIMQQEIAELSTDHELYYMEGGHVTIFTLKENADFICDHILDLSNRITHDHLPDQLVSTTPLVY